MNIRTKTIVTVLGAVIILLLSIYIVSSTILTKSFTHLENQKIEKNTEVLLAVIKTRMENMDILARDWGFWDDAYNFMQNRNTQFALSAFSPSICKDTKCNFIIMTDTSGHIVFAKGYDFEKEKNIPIPDSLRELLKQPAITQQKDKNATTQGLLVLPEGILMIASRGILKTDYTGPSRGAIIFARYLDAREVYQFSQTAHLGFTLFEVDSNHWDPRISSIMNKFKTKTPLVIEPVSATTINCYVQLTDIFNRPAAIFRITTSRDIYQQGQYSFYLLFLAIAIIGIIYLGITVYIVDHAILRRLVHFVDDIKVIEKQATLTYRFKVDGHDEFAKLSECANSMLDALEQAENAKNNFLAVISHEIRTPINGIVGMPRITQNGTIDAKTNQTNYSGRLIGKNTFYSG